MTSRIQEVLLRIAGHDLTEDERDIFDELCAEFTRIEKCLEHLESTVLARIARTEAERGRKT